ncbi:hypothetical protein C8Q77DRAFT_523211 [Trametes polyzona]|nr:hypothetical protein C8Q77DRAFT_523211 [Trametes polyzona]
MGAGRDREYVIEIARVQAAVRVGTRALDRICRRPFRPVLLLPEHHYPTSPSLPFHPPRPTLTDSPSAPYQDGPRKGANTLSSECSPVPLPTPCPTQQPTSTSRSLGQTQHFDDDGRKIGHGCFRGPDCHFLHPSDPQWGSAPTMRTVLKRKARGGGWGRDSGRGRGGSGGGGAYARPREPEPSKPTATSGWGSAPIAGSTWRDGGAGRNATSGAGAQPPAPSASTSTPAASAAHEPGPSPGGWDKPSRWDDSGSSWDSRPSAIPSTDPSGAAQAQEWEWATPDEQTSPAQEKKPDETTVGSGSPAADKTRDAEITTTPRPDQSPAHISNDPRRRPPPPPSSAALPPPPMASPTIPFSRPAGASLTPSEEAAQRLMARAAPPELETRVLSWGVSAPVPTAGSSRGAPPATNPFAFPAYTAPEKMDVVEEPPQEPTREVDMTEKMGDSSRPGSKAPSRAASPLSPVVEGQPATVLAQWKDFIRVLTKAVSLRLDVLRLNEIQNRQRAMRRSEAYRIGSLPAAHAQLERVREEHEAKAHRVKAKYDEYLAHLVRFPESGPPATPDPPVSEEVAGIQEWVVGIKAWLAEAAPLVQATVEKERAAAKAREEAEARAAAMEEARAKAATVASRLNDLDEQVTDLEYQIEDFRISPTNADEVVRTTMQARLGIALLEEGEVPPKTQAELAKDCAALEQDLDECSARLTAVMEQLEEHKKRSLTKNLAYFDLAKDTTRMQAELTEQQQGTSGAVHDTREGIDNLRTVLKDIEDRERPPPPPTLTFDQLCEHIVPILRPEVQAVVEEAIHAIRDGIDGALEKQQEDLCRQIWEAYLPVVEIIRSVKLISNNQPEVLMPPPPPPVQSVHHT